MPQRDAAPNGAPCWVDLFTSDPDKTEAFYGELFGWKAESAGEEFGGYVNFSKDGIPVAGSMKNDGAAGMPDSWSVYLATPDASATADTAVAKGGQVFMAPMQVADLGTMAMVGDAGKAAIGCWQPGTFNGFGVLGEPGTATWFELHTRDYDAAVEFYREVFAWDTHVSSDTPEFRYTTLGEGDGQLAGIMDASAFLPEGVPAHWAVYFGTEDTDATLARIVELGGTVVRPAEDTPYGRIAMAADPTGAIFRLVAGA
ncbi:MAG: VOC family protein [Actinomycetota bacterium]|nr:VOC family protein [Actinomycetota bacterium]